MKVVQILELFIRVMPHPEQITDIDISKETELRLTWRGCRLRITDLLSVEVVENGLLVSDNLSTTVKRILEIGRRV